MGLFQNFETVEPAKVKRSSRAKLGWGRTSEKEAWRELYWENFSVSLSFIPVIITRNLSVWTLARKLGQQSQVELTGKVTGRKTQTKFLLCEKNKTKQSKKPVDERWVNNRLIKRAIYISNVFAHVPSWLANVAYYTACIWRWPHVIRVDTVIISTKFETASVCCSV